jgi:hypothetical protein
MGEMRNAYNVLVEKPERKRPLGCPMCRWEDNIRMNPSLLSNMYEGLFHWGKAAGA